MRLSSALTRICEVHNTRCATNLRPPKLPGAALVHATKGVDSLPPSVPHEPRAQ